MELESANIGTGYGMTSDLEARVRSVVMKHLEDLAPHMVGKITDSSTIIRDIQLTGDDASVFAILSAKELGAQVPLREWRQVYTVKDAIQLLTQYTPPE